MSEKKFLTTKEVSERWHGNVSTHTLENWRNLGSGPPFTKIGGRVLYPIDKLVEWEQRNTFTSTSEYGRSNAA